MSKIAQSADALIAEVQTAVRHDLQANLSPILRRLVDAMQDLERALDGRGPGSGRRGRASGTAGKKRAGRGGKRTPRGALQAEVKKIVVEASGPLKLSQMRDKVLRTKMFKGRDPKTLYTMVVFVVNKMPEIKKNAAGLYGLRNTRPEKQKRKKRAKKIQRKKKVPTPPTSKSSS